GRQLRASRGREPEGPTVFDLAPDRKPEGQASAGRRCPEHPPLAPPADYLTLDSRWPARATNVRSVTAQTNCRAYSCDHTSERGWSPPQKQESDMSNFEDRELDVDQLDSVSGGDMALDIAVKAYEDLGKRLVAAAHHPVTEPHSPHELM